MSLINKLNIAYKQEYFFYIYNKIIKIPINQTIIKELSNKLIYSLI
jgi:hypothetical protein